MDQIVLEFVVDLSFNQVVFVSTLVIRLITLDLYHPLFPMLPVSFIVLFRLFRNFYCPPWGRNAASFGLLGSVVLFPAAIMELVISAGEHFGDEAWELYAFSRHVKSLYWNIINRRKGNHLFNFTHNEFKYYCEAETKCRCHLKGWEKARVDKSIIQ